MAGGADAGPAPQDVLEGVEGLGEGESGPGTFGARRCSQAATTGIIHSSLYNPNSAFGFFAQPTWRAA